MPNDEIAPAPQGARIATAEDAIAAIRAALGDTCRVVMVVSEVADGEVSGVVMGDMPEDDYIAAQELAAGVVYLIVGVGNLPTTQEAGVVVLSAPQQEQPHNDSKNSDKVTRTAQ